MKYLALSAATVLGLVALAAPAKAAVFSWNVDYTGWWEDSGGGSISGMFTADEVDAQDGIVSVDEMLSWTWSWSGNAVVPDFSISSSDAGATTEFSPSFYVNGTPNLPIGVDFVDPDGLDQGYFISGNTLLDLQALLIQPDASDLSAPVLAGNPAATLGKVSVADPAVVPEPATLLGLLALAGAASVTLKGQKQGA